MTTWLNTGTPHGCEPSIDAVEAKDEAFRILTRREPYTLRDFMLVIRVILHVGLFCLAMWHYHRTGDYIGLQLLCGMGIAGEIFGNILHRAAECDRKLVKLTMDLKALSEQDEHKTALMEQIIEELEHQQRRR